MTLKHWGDDRGPIEGSGIWSIDTKIQTGQQGWGFPSMWISTTILGSSVQLGYLVFGSFLIEIPRITTIEVLGLKELSYHAETVCGLSVNPKT